VVESISPFTPEQELRSMVEICAQALRMRPPGGEDETWYGIGRLRDDLFWLAQTLHDNQRDMTARCISRLKDDITLLSDLLELVDSRSAIAILPVSLPMHITAFLRQLNYPYEGMTAFRVASIILDRVPALANSIGFDWPSQRSTDTDIPEVPEFGPGVTFTLTPVGFEIADRVPPDAERDDPAQKSLHDRLRNRVEKLRGQMGRISNTHPSLFEEFSDYEMFVSPHLTKTDVASLWSAGTGLSEFVRALSERASEQSMTPPIEPECLAELRALLRDHTAFILGFATGRELMARVASLNMVTNTPQELKDTTLHLLQRMRQAKRLLAERADHLMASLVRPLEQLDTKALLLLSGGIETGKNALIALGRAMHPIVLISEGLNVGFALVGVENAETLTVTLRFLR
jgi:hypothetical protein